MFAATDTSDPVYTISRKPTFQSLTIKLHNRHQLSQFHYTTTAMINRLGLNTRVPYHFLFYSVVFGGSTFYSFIVSPIVFKKLPREEFSNLQSQVFPTYFIGQTVSPLILALTTPLRGCPVTATLLALSSISGALNYFWLLPACKTIKEERMKLVADKLDKDESGEFTEEYKKVSKQFGKYHGISSLFNLVSVVTLGVYGVLLTSRFK
jgi:hypothetical protein